MADPLPAGRLVPAGRARGGARGMVTLELAMASLGAAAVLVVLVWVLTVVVLLVRCQDAATGIARQEARGDHVAAARVEAAAPDDARVSVRLDHDQVEVTVALEARPWAAWLPSVPVSARATVIAEPA